MEIKNLQEEASRILKAVEDKENIILYGDSDLDGATSTIILNESIQTLGGNVSAMYFPDRVKEGHGITLQALDELKQFLPALLVSVDCGVSNVEEIKEAKRLGFDVVVVDHHKVPDELPMADIIVDPKQPDDMSPFKEFAAVGVVFKLSKLLLQDKMSASLKANFLELTALGTIADMMPQVDENKVFIERGLDSIKDSWRPGIKVFFEDGFLEDQERFYNKVSQMVSILNVQVRINRAPACFEVLTETSFDALKVLVQSLKEQYENKHRNIARLVERIEKKIEGSKDPIVFEGGKKYEYMLIPGAASIISMTFEKPTFLFKKMETESLGTVRSPVGIDSVDLMKKCKEYVITYGGHPRASGFRIKNSNLAKFKTCLIEKI